MLKKWKQLCFSKQCSFRPAYVLDFYKNLIKSVNFFAKNSLCIDSHDSNDFQQQAKFYFLLKNCSASNQSAQKEFLFVIFSLLLKQFSSFSSKHKCQEDFFRLIEIWMELCSEG
jgi:hypothetical protein